MSRRPRSSIAGGALCLVAIIGADIALGAPLSPTWNPDAMQAESEMATDPVLPIVESIGQASEPPQLGPMPRNGLAPLLRGADGANEILFAGGEASAAGVARLFEGVSAARDPVQLLPYEPTVALRIDAPGSGLLLLTAAALIALRIRPRIRRRLRG